MLLVILSCQLVAAASALGLIDGGVMMITGDASSAQAIAQSQDGVNRVSSLVMAMKRFLHPGCRELSPANLHVIEKKHGGKISVASEEGVGITFTILLPLPRRDEECER